MYFQAPLQITCVTSSALNSSVSLFYRMGTNGLMRKPVLGIMLFMKHGIFNEYGLDLFPKNFFPWRLI